MIIYEYMGGHHCTTTWDERAGRMSDNKGYIAAGGITTLAVAYMLWQSEPSESHKKNRDKNWKKIKDGSHSFFQGVTGYELKKVPIDDDDRVSAEVEQ